MRKKKIGIILEFIIILKWTTLFWSHFYQNFQPHPLPAKELVYSLKKVHKWCSLIGSFFMKNFFFEKKLWKENFLDFFLLLTPKISGA